MDRPHIPAVALPPAHRATGGNCLAVFVPAEQGLHLRVVLNHVLVHVGEHVGTASKWALRASWHKGDQGAGRASQAQGADAVGMVSFTASPERTVATGSTPAATYPHSPFFADAGTECSWPGGSFLHS